MIAQAPGEDRLATVAERAAWSAAVVVKEGGYPAVREALAKGRAPPSSSATPRQPAEDRKA
ncbi:hypothetical protein [Candidatus Thiosymbion oneisti]|uniref:hypothetical protein n=1 Tax=Candidatus Thiosymbion oneisti TaxID=589554 RepID=UPI00105F1948|nr:hypothetical protein [Candidatus Thiosymbion oneisti]